MKKQSRSFTVQPLFPVVYFNFNFYVRNTTWNADTGNHRERTHTLMIKNLTRRVIALSPTNTFPKTKRCVSSLECSRLPGTTQAPERTCDSSTQPIHISRVMRNNFTHAKRCSSSAADLNMHSYRRHFPPLFNCVSLLAGATANTDVPSDEAQ